MSVAGKCLYVKFMVLKWCFFCYSKFLVNSQFPNSYPRGSRQPSIRLKSCQGLSLVLSSNYGCRARNRGSRVNCFRGTELMQRNQLTAIKCVRTPNLFYIKWIPFKARMTHNLGGTRALGRHLRCLHEPVLQHVFWRTPVSPEQLTPIFRVFRH